MCILDVYSKIAHPFVMQYLVYFLASLTSLNAIFTFSKCAYVLSIEKTFNMSEANVIALPFHVKVFLINYYLLSNTKSSSCNASTFNANT